MQHYSSKDSLNAVLSALSQSNHFLFLFFFFLRHSLVCSVTQSAVQWHDPSSLQPLPSGFKRFSASAFQVAVIIGACQRAWLFFVFLLGTRFHHVPQAGLELLTSSDPPASASQSAEITGMSNSSPPTGSLFHLVNFS